MQTQLLSHHLAPGARVLEIGCGEGILLNELSSAGFNVQGIEPSQAASARARARGLHVIEGYFPNKAVDGPVDAVVLSHVLEHMPNPLNVLRQVAQLSPNGHLFLVQTNYKGLMALWRRAAWYAWVPEDHYWHFTPQGLAQLATQAGWQYKNCEFSSLVHPLLMDKFVVKVASVAPRFLDQFHLLLKRSEAGALHQLDSLSPPEAKGFE